MKLLLSHEFLKQSSKLKTKKKKTPAKNAKLTTSGIQSQITRYIKEAQNTVYTEEKNQSIEVGLKITQMLELVDKDIVTVTTVPNVQKTKRKIEYVK